MLLFIGNLDFFKFKLYIWIVNLKEIYGDIFSLKVGKWDVVVVCLKEGIIEGLIDFDNNFDGRLDFLVFYKLFMGNR